MATKRKISELTALASASLDTTIVGVDRGTTYKIELDTLADAVKDRINTLDDIRLDALENFTSSYVTSTIPTGTISGSSQLTSSFDQRYTLSGSVQNILLPSNLISSSAQISNLGFISSSTDLTSLNQFTASQSALNTAFVNGINARLQTSSFDAFSSSVHSEILAATNEQSLSHLVTTASFNDYTASISTGSLADRLNTIENISSSWITENETGSFATTGSNTFIGTQIYSGSVYVTGDVIIYGSSSLQNISASAINIGSNLIYLNTYTPSVAFAGIVVYDSGSNGGTGSLLWDSNNNNWVYQNPEGEGYASAKLIAGPTSSLLGAEEGLITGRLTVAQADDHISSSQITDDGQLVTIPGTLKVLGSSIFGSGSFNQISPEKFLVIQDNPNDYNIVVAKANTDNYSQLVVTNLNNGISASSDLIVQADNGGETNMYADLGVNSSGYTGNGNGIGAANDAYVYGKAKNFWVGNLTTQSLYIFANPNGIADITLVNGIFDISGSLIVSGGITGSLDYSNIIHKPNLISASSQLTASYDERYTLSGSIQSVVLPSNLISSSTQITDLGFISSSQTINTASFVTTASYNNDSASFDSRIQSLVSSGVPSGTVSGSSQLTSSFDQRYTLSGSVQNILLPSNLISSSAQITDLGFISSSTDITKLNEFTQSYYSDSSSFDIRIVELVNNTALYETTGRNIISGSSQIVPLLPTGIISGSNQLISVFAQLNGGNTFNGVQIFNDPIQANAITASSLTVTTFYAVSSSVASTSGSTSFGSINTDIMFVTGSIRATNDISASTINGLGNATQYSSSVNNRLNGLENTTSSYETKGRGILSGSSQLSGTTIQNLSGSFTGSFKGDIVGSLTGTAQYASQIAVVTTATTNDSTLYPVFTNTSASNANNLLKNHPSGTFYYDGVTRKVYAESFVGSIEATNGVISGSSQLTSSYDARYVISGSITQTTWDNIASKPAGIISGSAQITSFGFVSGSYETTGRGILSGSISYTSLTNIPSAIISSSAQITALGFVSSSTSVPAGTISGSSQLTASFDTRYALSGSVGGGSIPAGTISGSAQLTASFDGRYVQTGSYNSYTASINSFTSSHNIWSSSIATTGSNSFNGNQTITGSLTVSSIATISSSIAANASSLTLSSGSNLYIQNNGIAEISGSLRVSGSTILTGSISISSGSITMPNRPAFRVIGTASTDRSSGLILSGSAVSVDYNEGGYFSITNGKFTAPTAGLYNVYFNGRVGSVNSSMQVIVYKNTNVVQFMWEAAGNSGATHFGVSGIVKLAANDTLEAKVTVGSIQFDANDSFGVTYIG